MPFRLCFLYSDCLSKKWRVLLRQYWFAEVSYLWLLYLVLFLVDYYLAMNIQYFYSIKMCINQNYSKRCKMCIIIKYQLLLVQFNVKGP
jgi:hypothetical protein